MSETILTFPQSRILGCMIEKQFTTPLNYPMTPNAVRVACNQKSNRDPVVEYDDDAVFDLLKGLEKRGFLESGLLDGTQTVKYRHRLPQALGLERGEVVILCELFNRGPQTMAELRARCDRMHRFSDLADVERCLGLLAGRNLVTMLERQPGSREHRWAHLFCGKPAAPAPGPASPRPSPEAGTPDLEARVAQLEAQIRALEGRLEALEQR